MHSPVLLLAAVSFTILLRVLLGCQPPHSTLAKAVGDDYKGKVSLLFYAAGAHTVRAFNRVLSSNS